MIHRLKLENFRSHGDTEFRFEPMSLLVGPAGAGKSNLLKAIVFLQNSVHRPLVELLPPGTPWEFRNVRSRWADETAPMGFEVDVVVGDQLVRYALRLAEAPSGVYVLAETMQRCDTASNDDRWHWVFQRRWDGKPEVGEFGRFETHDSTVLNRVWYQFGANPTEPGPRLARAVAKTLWKAGYYHLEVSALRQPGEDLEVDRIGYRGERLPPFLASLQRSAPDRFEAIIDGMRELLPTLDRVVLNRIGPDRQGLAMTFTDQRGFTNAPDLSDGTLLTLGLLAVTNASKQPRMLCLEEPETGLHPRRLRWVFDQLLAMAYPRSQDVEAVQIILTSHSPYLVNLFRDMPEAITIVEHEKGRSRAHNLVDVRQHLHSTARGSEIGHEWATGLYEGL